MRGTRYRAPGTPCRTTTYGWVEPDTVNLPPTPHPPIQRLNLCRPPAFSSRDEEGSRRYEVTPMANSSDVKSSTHTTIQGRGKTAGYCYVISSGRLNASYRRLVAGVSFPISGARVGYRLSLKVIFPSKLSKTIANMVFIHISYRWGYCHRQDRKADGQSLHP